MTRRIHKKAGETAFFSPQSGDEHGARHAGSRLMIISRHDPTGAKLTDTHDFGSEAF